MEKLIIIEMIYIWDMTDYIYQKQEEVDCIDASIKS